MKNFQITAKEDGKKYWISRSIAVASFIFSFIDNKLCILANLRGSGTPDFQNCWNCPCGYLDYDETTKEAACREVREETGIVITPNDLILHYVQDDPCENQQNVTLRYRAFITSIKEVPLTGGEENEVAEIKWIPINEIDNYTWAFNHNQIIKSIYNDIFRTVCQTAY